MPELPEVETVVRSILPLVGKRIVSAEFRNLRVLRGGDPDAMAARLAGRKIASVKRYGKFIVASLAGGGYLMVHLGMTGKLLLGGDAGKHTHAIVKVLTEAIAAGGSSISDYVDAQGRKGFFQFKHRVYQRTGEPCLKCRTPIRRVVVTQRSSHFCPQCQKR